MPWKNQTARSNLVRLQLLVGNFGPRIPNYLRSFKPSRHFPSHSSCFARFSKMGGPILVTSHRMHCTAPLSQASPSSSPYRPAVILPGLGNNSGDYQKLVQTLNDKYGVPTVVAKVSRIDWLRNAAGLVDPNYWRGTLKPRPVLDWYLKRVHDAVQEAKELAEG